MQESSLRDQLPRISTKPYMQCSLFALLSIPRSRAYPSECHNMFGKRAFRQQADAGRCCCRVYGVSREGLSQGCVRATPPHRPPYLDWISQHSIREHVSAPAVSHASIEMFGKISETGRNAHISVLTFSGRIGCVGRPLATIPDAACLLVRLIP